MTIANRLLQITFSGKSGKSVGKFVASGKAVVGQGSSVAEGFLIKPIAEVADTPFTDSPLICSRAFGNVVGAPSKAQGFQNNVDTIPRNPDFSIGNFNKQTMVRFTIDPFNNPRLRRSASGALSPLSSPFKGEWWSSVV